MWENLFRYDCLNVWKRYKSFPGGTENKSNVFLHVIRKRIFVSTVFFVFEQNRNEKEGWDSSLTCFLSYDRKKAANLSIVGWIIFCKDSGLQMTVTFWEKSPSASLFRAEMLGLACLHLLARAVAEFFATGHWTAVVLCNNKKALELLSHHRRRIRPSAKCANIRRSFRATKQTFKGGFKYIHILWTHGPIPCLE